MRDAESSENAHGKGAAAPPRRPHEEAARLGKEIFERDILPQVEADHHGEVVAIDVASGSWGISDDLRTATKRLRAQHPAAIDVWSVRVGYRVIGSIGGGFPRRSG